MLRDLHRVTLLTATLCFGPQVVTSQSLSWVVPTTSNTYGAITGLIPRANGSVATMARTGSWSSVMATFDWQGTEAVETHWPWVTAIRSTRYGGYVTGGKFVGSFELNGQTYQGGSGFGEVWLSRADAEDDIEWVKHSVTVTTNGPVLIGLATSPSGRTGMLFFNNPSFIWDADTILSIGTHDQLVMSLDSTGTMEWYQWFHGLEAQPPFDAVSLAFDDSERLWVAANQVTDVLVDGNIIEVIDPGQFDHTIMQFAPNGGLIAHRIVPSGDPVYHTIMNSGMIAHPDGGILWYGRAWDGATMNGISLDSAGLGSNGLIMRLDDDIQLIWHRTFGSDAPDRAGAASLDTSTGKFMLTGIAGNGTTIGPDTIPDDAATYAFLATLDPDGTIERGRFFLSTAAVQPSLLGVGPIFSNNGVCHVAGHSAAPSLFTNGTWIGDTDFIARFDADGTASIPSITRSATSFQVFPCPSHGPVDIRHDRSINGPCNVSVKDALGSTVRQQSLVFSAGAARLDLSGLAKGVYTIHLNSTEDPAVQRVIIE